MHAPTSRGQRSLDFDPGDELRAVVAAQVVFTIGHVLTTGAFLTYFAYALQPTTLMLAVLAVTPEISETVAIWSRSVILALGSRKRTWLIGFILARVAALGIPAMAIPVLRPDDTAAFWILIASLAVSHACQSIAYTAYISWLSDLFPRQNWGSAFALRRIAHVAVMILIPAIAALLRRDWNQWTADDAVRRAYFAVFLGGNVLLWLTLLPVWRLPDLPIEWNSAAGPSFAGAVAAVWRSQPLRLVVASALWLSAFQGFSQTAVLQYSIGVLNVPLEAYLLLSGLMYALQIPISWWGGVLSDRGQDRRGLVVGLYLVSSAMGFWMLARPGHANWLIAAYAVWGLFGLVNICQRNLLLKTAAASDNAVPIAVLEHVAGLVAGLAGLAGGWLLAQLVRQSAQEAAVWPYLVIFLISWIGRATAALWLFPVREPTT